MVQFQHHFIVCSRKLHGRDIHSQRNTLIQNGNNSSGKKKSGTNNILYTIYSCGCNAAASSCDTQNNVIIPLEAVVTLVN